MNRVPVETSGAETEVVEIAAKHINRQSVGFEIAAVDFLTVMKRDTTIVIAAGVRTVVK